MRNAIRLAVVLVSALALFACSKYDCNQTNGKCSGDTPPNARQLNQCNALLDDPHCGEAFRTYGTCVLDHEECGSDGTGNFGAAALGCPNEYSAWTSCCDANRDAGSCPLVL